MKNKNNANNDWILPVCLCFFLTGIFLWIFFKILPFLETEDKILNDFLVRMVNFEDLGIWVLLFFVMLLLNAILAEILVSKIRKNNFFKKGIFR